MSTFESDRSFFALFQLPETYSVDTAELEQRYRQLQREVHPDKHVNADPAQRRRSVEQSALVNEAYQTLRQPVARAMYLLKRQSFNGDMDNRSLPPAFLMQQIELREALAQVRESTDPEGAVDQLDQQLRFMMEENTCAFADAYECGDLDRAADAVARMQFVTKLAAELERIESELLDD